MPNVPKYPYGMHGLNGEMYFTVIDLNSDGSLAAIGGYCNDANICGPGNPNPIIAVMDTDTINFAWKNVIRSSFAYS